MIRISFTPLVAGLFGHRHTTDPLVVVWWRDVTLWASDHWTVLVVVIPVAGLIVAGIVNHYLTLARETRARRLGRSDVRARVHADLAVRLLSHCSYIQASIGSPQADASAWRPGNVSLRTRAEMPDVIEVLGKDYVPFMAAVEKERRTIETLERNGRRPERISVAAVDVIDAYVSFICEFGEERQGRRLAAMARDAVKHG